MAGGRPKHKPTEKDRNTVKVMVAVGIPHEQIADVIGIDDKTLRKHYGQEIKTAKAEANAKVGQTLFNKAVNGDTTAAIWWSKSQMGWKDASRVEITGEDGAPLINIKFVGDKDETD